MRTTMYNNCAHYCTKKPHNSTHKMLSVYYGFQIVPR